MAIHGVGGGGATEHENGETALPVPHHRPVPHANVLPINKDSAWLDVRGQRQLWRGYWDTDGCGELLFVRTTHITAIYGVDINILYATQLSTATKPDLSETTRSRRRRSRLQRIARWLKSHPGATKWDVALRFDVSSATAWHDLAVLRQEGRAVSTLHYGVNGGTANSTWSAP